MCLTVIQWLVEICFKSLHIFVSLLGKFEMSNSLRGGCYINISNPLISLLYVMCLKWPHLIHVYEIVTLIVAHTIGL